MTTQEIRDKQKHAMGIDAPRTITVSITSGQMVLLNWDGPERAGVPQPVRQHRRQYVYELDADGIDAMRSTAEGIADFHADFSYRMQARRLLKKLDAAAEAKQ